MERYDVQAHRHDRRTLHNDYNDTSNYRHPRIVLSRYPNNVERPPHQQRPQASSSQEYEQLSDLEFDQDDEESETYSPAPRQRRLTKRKQASTTRNDSLEGFVVPDDEVEDYEEPKRARIGERQSTRTTRHQGAMQEKTIDDIYRSENDTVVPARLRAVGALEMFQEVDLDNEFTQLHTQNCDACGQDTHAATFIYCQGCSLAYHQECLGARTTRAHLVTKISEIEFVLQCKRCVGTAQKKCRTAPHHGKCQHCLELGDACQPFRLRKTALQEQKERDENGGVDPVTQVDQGTINNPDNILFRCTSCYRAWHVDHLPARTDEDDNEMTAEDRYSQYAKASKCSDCADMPGKITTIIAWRPSNEANFDEDLAYELVDEDDKDYLIKFEGQSYFHAVWMPGAWVCAMTVPAQLKAFAKRSDAQQPKLTTEDAIPEDYLLTDVILDVTYTTSTSRNEARVNNIEQALVKYKGLTYEDAVWEEPPDENNIDQWTSFMEAYADWTTGQQLRMPNKAQLASDIALVRRQSFREQQAQPQLITGGTLMPYQVLGMNWLFHRWHNNHNAILGDEMGLGKTIQIIAFLAVLIERLNCFPFLIVVPNSTCPNWRREIKQWAPSLKVATYYGSKESKEMVSRYELFPNGSKDMHCHIVITSYESAADDSTRKVLKQVKWQALVVDEGQRLKNDESNLYASLRSLNVPFKVLLTGTPLQNNQRELFNLLQFLDKGRNAAQLEEQYQELDSSKIAELHRMIRPYFLRRTKRQVLQLPPMQQVVLPVSMSLVQKKVYKTILTKNSDLMRAILGGGNGNKTERANLNNILMQLRKCLCHPFVYSRDIEERTSDQHLSHHNLVAASNKLKLLELMLPMLRAGGHRVLIFSQFLDCLDIIEDFLNGIDLPYQRLDGNVSSLERQKRIDRFNAPDSSYFAFLLSTRAGGVGINLATADTVIILDPDFNPHQDIQALSRAHRIGQKNKVLCFRLITVDSAEERILSVGKRKLALDKALIQHIDDGDSDQSDLISVLRHGVKEIFKNGDRDIVYDQARVAALLDRSQVKDSTDADVEASDNQWSFAEVWKEDQPTTATDNHAIDLNTWDAILKDRESAAAKEAAKRSKALGRGGRQRTAVDYTCLKTFKGIEGLDNSIDQKATAVQDDSDVDFDNNSAEVDSDDENAQSLQHAKTRKPVDDSGKKCKKAVPSAPSKGISAKRGKVLFQLDLKKPASRSHGRCATQ